MPFEYVKLDKSIGDAGMGWLSICPIKDFTSIKVPVGPFTNPGDSIRISVAHTYPAGKEPIRLPIPLNGSELDHESFGENSVGSKQTIKYFLTGLTPEQVEFLENAANEPIIAFQKDATCKSNQIWQVGCECNPARLNYKFGSGTKGNGEKGWNLEIMGACGLYSYEAVLPERA